MVQRDGELPQHLEPFERHVELAGEPALTRSTFVSGLKSLPIRYELD